MSSLTGGAMRAFDVHQYHNDEYWARHKEFIRQEEEMKLHMLAAQMAVNPPYLVARQEEFRSVSSAMDGDFLSTVFNKRKVLLLCR